MYIFTRRVLQKEPIETRHLFFFTAIYNLLKHKQKFEELEWQVLTKPLAVIASSPVSIYTIERTKKCKSI